nr:MAG: glycosyltransferase [Leptolyngbya sp. IPPAS B-1204]
MSKKVVGMITSYEGLSQGDWLWKQTPQPFGVWKDIQILRNAPNPDFLLLYQYNFFQSAATSRRNRLLSNPLGILNPFQTSNQPQPAAALESSAPDLRGIAKERAIYLLREPPLPEILQKNQANYLAAQDYCGYVSGPDDSAPTPDYMPAIWYVSNTFEELDKGRVPDKLRACSWITSGINRTENHRKRLDFLHQLQQTPGVQIDVFGRNLPATVQTIGELQNKWYGMAPYYYNLAIENYADNHWYVSEKLWDALLCWCLPIYYGGPAADHLLPPDSFLRLPSLDEKGVAYIQEVTSTPEAWYAAKDAIAEARQIILHKLNLLNWLSELVEKF